MVRVLFSSSRGRQQGSALVYILIAVALLAALTVAFMEPSSQQGQSQNTFKTTTALRDQVSLIQSAIQECTLAYPGGDSTIVEAGYHAPYPMTPTSAHLLNPDADNKVKHIRCPGDPGTSNDHADIFSSATGKFMPPAPALFEDWKYYNSTDGVFFWIDTAKSDAYLQTALAKLEEEYAECESDVIDATSGAVDMDVASTVAHQCPNGHRCFRFWMVREATTDPTCP